MMRLFGTIGSHIEVIDACVRILISILIGSIIGYERERKNRPAGLRTHVLVCMAASLVSMVEQEMIYEVNTLSSQVINLSFGRLSVGIISGIGFIGAGTIMMSKSKIVGLTTAASLWCTACLGLINGIGYWGLSVIASILVILILQVMRLGEKTRLSRIIEVIYINESDSNKLIESSLKQMNVQVKDYSVSFYKENETKMCATHYSIVFKDKDEIRNVMEGLSNLENVTAVRIENVM